MAEEEHPHLRQFMWCCFNDLAQAEEMLRAEPLLISAKTSHVGETALHYLAIEDCLPGVEFLILHGADVNTTEDSGATPLIDASVCGYLEMVRLLLSAGARPNVVSLYNGSALHAASEDGHVGIIECLLEHGADVEICHDIEGRPLHSAAKSGHAGAVQALIHAGADVNTSGCFDWRPLHYAARAGNLEVCRLLLDAGAKIDAPSCLGPPLLSIEKCDMSLVEFFLQRGARLDAMAPDGKTLLHNVAYHGLLDVAKFLLSRGFNPLQPDEKGSTAIDEAVRGGQAEMAGLLRGYSPLD